jgi:2,3-dihydroxyphenylpropionate 1,2-dioxygenase
LAAGTIYGTPESTLTPLNPEWDRHIIDLLLGGDLDAFDHFDIAKASREAGRSSHEIRTWVAAFAALSAFGAYTGRLDYYRAINAWIAGYGIVSADPRPA